MKPICPGCNKELQITNHLVHFHIEPLSTNNSYHGPLIVVEGDYECDACALEYLMPEMYLKIRGKVIFKGDWNKVCRAFKLKVFL